LTHYPIYREVNGINTVICGVNHHVNPEENIEEKRKFLDSISDCEHLLFETNGRAPIHDGHIQNYESLAFGTNPRNSRFLEEGFDPRRVYSNRGVPRKMAVFYETVMTTELGLTINPGGTVIVNDIINYYKHVYSLGNRQIDLLNQQWGAFLDYCSKSGNASAITEIGRLFKPFSMNVRDYDVIGPTAQKLIRELSGRKGIIVGSLHLDFLGDFLSGEETKSPNSWHEVIEESPTKVRKTIKDVEKRLSKPMA
ncbi:hypothetical protein HY450_03310, partial [Candidatus Pacearchaeota archaeon]|nr:hypothetical protein [Candidatus Pacearchaeota archaeon]